jgi:hypothetical protein
VGLVALVKDDTNREQDALHALVIGVSAYPYVDGPKQTRTGSDSGLSSLTAAARSASEVAAWLLEEYRNPDVPLGSLHVLLSPAKREKVHPTVKALLGTKGAPATIDAVRADLREFRQRCKADPAGTAFVYIAGHGVQVTSRDAIVLLEDFAHSDYDGEPLFPAIDVVGEQMGMRGDAYSQRQVWFVDACRTDVDEGGLDFDDFSPPSVPSKPPGDVTTSPVFLASAPRTLAFAQTNKTTLFSQALLSGLRGAACGPREDDAADWAVTVFGLGSYLPQEVARLAAEEDEVQKVDQTGRFLDTTIHRFENPPEVELTVALDPAGTAKAVGALLDADDRPVKSGIKAWPYTKTVKAGSYRVEVAVDGDAATRGPRFVARPLATAKSVTVGP